MTKINSNRQLCELYVSLVRSVVLCGSEAWTVRRVDSGGVRSGLFDVEDATTLSCSSAAVTVSE